MSTDSALGKKIHEHLLSVGMETPMNADSFMNTEHQIATIQPMFDQIFKVLGLDLTDDSLAESPKRVAKMYVNEIFKGLDYNNFPKCTVIDNKMASELVVIRGIKVHSCCEHHLQPFVGTATIGYIPAGKVMGLSKFNRIVDFFSRRPQVQERLTNQIWHTLNYILETDNIAVYLDSEHYCVKLRGVMDQGSSTTTDKLGGGFMTTPSLRSEFMSIATKG